MSKMTSSSASSASNRPPKLTDFSIETIIGAAAASQQQASPPLQPHPHEHQMSSSKVTTDSSHQHHQHHKQQDSSGFRDYAASSQAAGESVAQNAATSRKYRPKNFQCPACKMAFSNNGQLKNHVRIHTGERPFRCNQPDCNKTFTRNEELTRHKMIHTGVRPHACTACGKRFGRKDHLKKHVRTHDRKKLRKKVFVPAATFLEDDVFAPPKSSRSSISSSSQNVTNSRLASILPMPMPMPSTTGICPTSSAMLPPNVTTVAFPHLHSHHHQTTTRATTTTTASTAAAVAAAASNTIQQIASDYWYNLIGFYQHQQHYPPADRLSSLFRKS